MVIHHILLTLIEFSSYSPLLFFTRHLLSLKKLKNKKPLNWKVFLYKLELGYFHCIQNTLEPESKHYKYQELSLFVNPKGLKEENEVNADNKAERCK